MNIQIVAVGKLKEKYLKDAVLEYTKRLSRFCRIEIVEIPEEKAPETLSDSEEDQVREKEAQRIRKAIAKNSFLVALDLNGAQPDSVQFAENIDFMLNGISQITFIIGAPLVWIVSCLTSRLQSLPVKNDLYSSNRKAHYFGADLPGF